MIGENIKKYRIDSGLTQKELADKLVVSYQAVSRWENNEVEPNISTIAKIAEIFGITIDELCGKEPKEKEVVHETKYVYDEPIQQVVIKEESKQMLALCEKCNNPIYDSDDIYRYSTGGRHATKHVICMNCKRKKDEADLKAKLEKSHSRKINSFIWGGIIAAVFVIVGIISAANSGAFADVIIGIALAYPAFAFMSCLILGNNFIGDMVISIMGFGFVKFPGIIFSFDLDGLAFLIAIKILFFVIGIFLAACAAAIGICLGIVLSIFVYPYAISKNINHPEQIDL